jgi:hypothetical protein
MYLRSLSPVWPREIILFYLYDLSFFLNMLMDLFLPKIGIREVLILYILL